MEFSEKYLEIPGKYLENESGIWLATLCKLSLNSFILKTLKEFQLKCEACDWYSYTKMLINKYGHAGISFLTKMYQFIVQVSNNHKS